MSINFYSVGSHHSDYSRQVLQLLEFDVSPYYTQSNPAEYSYILPFLNLLIFKQVRISERFNENISMRQSTMINNAIRNVKKDLLGQPLQLLSGVDILGNASSALGHMSQGIAALSMDKKFIQSRQRQVSSWF